MFLNKTVDLKTTFFAGKARYRKNDKHRKGGFTLTLRSF